MFIEKNKAVLFLINEKFKKYNYAESGLKNYLQEKDGLFSGLSNIITPAVNFIKSNADVMKTGTQAISSVSTAGKNINDAINATYSWARV